MKLTQKQETFCIKYFELGNASEAALIAGYSPRSIRNIASVTLTNANVQARIHQLRQIAEDESVATVIERKQILTEIARGNLLDYQEVGADGAWLNIGKESPHTKAIAEITSRTDEKDSVIIKVKLHNPTPAIDLLNKMEKIYTDGMTQNIDNRKVEANIVYFDAKEVARAIIEAIQLGLNPAILGGDGHGEDATLLSPSTDIQTTLISEPEN